MCALCPVALCSLTPLPRIEVRSAFKMDLNGLVSVARIILAFQFDAVILKRVQVKQVLKQSRLSFSTEEPGLGTSEGGGLLNSFPN